LISLIKTNYGSYRGAARLWLDLAKSGIGIYRDHARVDWKFVSRLVFVCWGNVCRSPYAQHKAASARLPVVSFGISGVAGRPVHPVALQIAKKHGVDLAEHSVLSPRNFEPQEGDVYFVMEDRQIDPLQRILADRCVVTYQVALLGLWARPIRPLIYDPMGADERYFETCYSVIDSAVQNLLREHLVSS